MRRLALAVAVAMIMATFGGGIAAADPVNSKQAHIIPVTCSNGQAYQVIVVAAGLPAHIVGSNSNVIPTEFTFTYIDPDTGEVLFSETKRTVGQGLKVGPQDDLITCTGAPETFVDPETGETIAFVLSVEAFLTPRGR